jgi:AraC-like DNA-binding protein
MVESNVGEPRGLLNRKAGEKKFQLSMHAPSPDLAFFIMYYWIVSWDLRGQEPYLSENLPHPCVHLVIEQGKSSIYGVVTGKFSYLLVGTGRVFGFKFRPGAFCPFVKMPVAQFTDTTVSLQDVFGANGSMLEEAILAAEDKAAMIAHAEQFLRQRLPERDENIEVINQIIDRIITDPEITKVDDVVCQFNLTKRMVQRLFHHYVGVGPKRVIKRYRLLEAAEQVAKGNVVDWSKLALDLGYFDQAHFIKDFKSIVGKAPAEYTQELITP